MLRWISGALHGTRVLLAPWWRLRVRTLCAALSVKCLPAVQIVIEELGNGEFCGMVCERLAFSRLSISHRTCRFTRTNNVL